MPSGPITWETATWLVTVLIGAISGASTVAGFGWRFYRSLVGRIEKEEARAAAAERQLTEALTALSQHTAETYATKSGVTVAVQHVEVAVQQLTGQVQASVDRLSDRIDRLLELQAHGPPARSSPRRASSSGG